MGNISNYLENLDATKVRNFWLGVTITLLTTTIILFSFVIPFGYELEVVEGDTLYQYQDLTKEDLVLKEIWFRIPFDNQPVREDYSIAYADYNELSTAEYIKKYNLDNPANVGEQVVLGNKEGKLTVLINKDHSFISELPMVKAKSAEVGYDGACHIGDVLDPSKLYLDVVYEDGSEKRFTDALFTVVGTEDLVLKQGFNNFTVSYAGEIFPVSVSCTEGA